MSIGKRSVFGDAQSYQIQVIRTHINKAAFCTQSYQLNNVIT
ncbi:hypothetical protein PQG02_03700 [Nostoc sp. UHCC 0926]|nr:hypothetical protein PQG02_03700 [Nostoc sp. UHCC 0926]